MRASRTVGGGARSPVAPCKRGSAVGVEIQTTGDGIERDDALSDLED